MANSGIAEPTTLEEAFEYVEECVKEQQEEFKDVGPDDVAHDVIVGICYMWRTDHPEWVPEILRCTLGVTPKEVFHD